MNDTSERLRLNGSEMSGPFSAAIAGIRRDPFVAAAVGLVVLQLFTRLTFDVVLSMALIAIILRIGSRRD